MSNQPTCFPLLSNTISMLFGDNTMKLCLAPLILSSVPPALNQTITGTGWQPYQIYHVAFRYLDRGCNQANLTFAGFSNEIVTNEKLNDERMQTITPDIFRMN